MAEYAHRKFSPSLMFLESFSSSITKKDLHERKKTLEFVKKMSSPLISFIVRILVQNFYKIVMQVEHQSTLDFG